ncbi:RcnB family protein [Paraburkholderia sp. C35]|uniref:RcnB family protein n=1 Tax=Paraburkholderia sp. C35 TaxID=2126993 RepID=UPI000D694DAD|nr:RcnB family protein [Paraburkholderia sp. C35]
MKKTVSVVLLAVSCVVAQGQAFAQYAPGDDGGPGHHSTADERGGSDGPGGPGGPVHREASRGPVPHRDWHRGDRLPPDYRGPQYVVDDWRGYDLQPPPSGYQWVQVNGDFVLAAVATGVISSILLAAHR